MVEIKTVWDGDTTSYLVIANGKHVSSHWTYEEAKDEADKYEEVKAMKNVKFELNTVTYESNAKGTHFYKTIDGKKTRISRDEFEADYELFKREQKVEQDAKTAEEAVAKKSKKRNKKNVAFTFTGVSGTETTLTEKQVDFIEHVPDTCFYENGLDSAIWIDVLADEIGGQFTGKPMTVGAMVSTLREKGIISVGEDRVNGKRCKFFEFTELGKILAGELGLK